MGKKKKSESLGRALIKDRFSSKGKRNDTMLHTSELNDGYDWGRLNLQSVTEESSFDDFLRTAQLAGTEFQAEKLNIKFVKAGSVQTVLTNEERRHFEITKKTKADLLRIPRRPKWDRNTTADQLQAMERETFLDWRRGLAALQDVQGLVLTPYEKNLDFWRQLWRVIERSDVIVQIVDARNPLLFYHEDLERYGAEVSQNKANLLLLNKSDFLTDSQREKWSSYFNSIGVRCAFYSSISHLDSLKQQDEVNDCQVSKGEKDSCKNEPFPTDDCCNKASDVAVESTSTKQVSGDTEQGLSSSKLLTREQLIQLFQSFMVKGSKTIVANQITVGLVGYPNVGKSSAINSLISSKKVSVSATPGKTKHLQMIGIEDTCVMLCDCPGLVFPSLVATKADMLLSGILPINHMRDFTEAVTTLRSLVPDYVLQEIYGIMIPQQPPGVHQHAPQTLLSSYAYSRGFMTANGCPNMSQAARIILSDFVKGKILYCFAPPSSDQESYHSFPSPTKKPPQLTAIAARAIADRKIVSVNDLDSSFFDKISLGAHSKGSTMAGTVFTQPTDPKSSSNSAVEPSKPWKDHSHKRNKKEKLRRVYRHLDE